MRIPAPNYTQTPNDLFDEWIPHLNESELKVLLVIIRKTFGWHKERDRISISQLERFTGLSEPSVLGAIKSLVSKGVIRKETIGEIGKQQSFYELVVESSNNSYPPRCLGGPPKIVGGGTPQDTWDTKETLSLKETNTKQQQQGAMPPAPPAAAVSQASLLGKIKYRTPGGIEKSISESEIYSYFLKKPYKTEIIQQAIEVLKQKNEPIGNVFKLLEVICLNLQTQVISPTKTKLPETSVPFCTSPVAKETPWNRKDKK